MKLKAPKDEVQPFKGCSQAVKDVEVIFPCNGVYSSVTVPVYCWEDKFGEFYLSSITVAYLDLVKAYYWHKNSPPISKDDVSEGLLRLYKVLDENNKISPHVVLNKEDFDSPIISTLLYRAIQESTIRNFKGSPKELLDAVYDWL